MEISPIPGIRLQTFGKTPPAVIGLQPVFDIANYAHISDESYTPSEEASSSGMEDGFYDSGEPAEEPEAQSAVPPGEDEVGRILNLIA